MDKLLAIEVKGKSHKWSFSFMGDPKHLDDWRADGLEVNEIVETIPVTGPEVDNIKNYINAQGDSVN